MVVAEVTVIMDMDCLQPVVTEGEDRVGGLLSDKAAVTEIKAGGEVSGIEGIDVIGEVAGVAADARDYTAASCVPTPHIFKAYCNPVLLCVRQERAVI